MDAADSSHRLALEKMTAIRDDHAEKMAAMRDEHAAEVEGLHSTLSEMRREIEHLQGLKKLTVVERRKAAAFQAQKEAERTTPASAPEAAGGAERAVDAKPASTPPPASSPAPSGAQRLTQRLTRRRHAVSGEDEMVLSYLAQFGKADHTEGVIKALKLAEHHPSRWVQELQTLAEQSLLDGFLASCQKNAEWAAAKGIEEPSRRRPGRGKQARKVAPGQKPEPEPEPEEAEAAMTQEELAMDVVTLNRPAGGSFGINVSADCKITAFSSYEAQSSGMQLGSRIARINGKRVNNKTQVAMILRKVRPGEPVAFLLDPHDGYAQAPPKPAARRTVQVAGRRMGRRGSPVGLPAAQMGGGGMPAEGVPPGGAVPREGGDAVPKGGRPQTTFTF